MRVVFTIRTRRFKGAAPRPGAINEMIGGDELASWLADALRDAGIAAVDPWPTDHGWDFAARSHANDYVIVCSRDFDESADESGRAPVHFVQVVLQRSLLDKLLWRRTSDGRTDPVAGAVRSILAQQSDFEIIHETCV